MLFSPIILCLLKYSTETIHVTEGRECWPALVRAVTKSSVLLVVI